MKKRPWCFRVLAMVMTFCMSFLFVGCFGLGYGDLDADEIEGMTDEELEEWLEESSPAGMYGTKVLYRPSSYSYDESSRPLDDLTSVNDYYSQYAWEILEYLQNIYNVFDSKFFAGSNYKEKEISTLTYPSASDLPYIYDSSRYVVTEAEEHLYCDADGAESYEFTVTADTSYAWKWSYDVNSSYFTTTNETSTTNDFSAFINEGSGTIKTTTIEGDADQLAESISKKYKNQFFKKYYQTAFVGDGKQKAYDLYSQYANTLAYVIYRYALDLSLENIVITKKTDTSALKTGENADQKLVQITIGGKDTKTALNEAKALFEKHGRIVGMTDDLIKDVRDFILENIIGKDARQDVSPQKKVYTYTQKTDTENHPIFQDNGKNEYIKVDGFYYSGTVSEETKVDVSGLSPVYNEPSVTTSTLYSYSRDYEATIDKIIEKVNTVVLIGGIEDDEEDEVDVNNPYIASEIVEYAGPMFFISDDDNFPRAQSSKASALTSIPAREYQSLTFMFKESVTIGTLGIALKYDSNCDGTGETKDVDESGNDYLEISLDLNYYNHAAKKLTTYSSPKLRIYSGSYEFGYEEGWDCTVDSPKTEDVTEHSSGYIFDGLDITVGAFNTSIGNKVLMTDVGLGGYKSKPIVSKTPLVLTGHSRLKNWYEIVGGIDSFYSGRLNHQRFIDAGNEGCDYLEVTYKVYKDDNNPNKNYKFYTGISMLLDF